MSSEPETSTAPDNSAPNPLDVPPRKRWQFNIRLIFLAMAALGVWMAVVVNRRAIPQLQRRVDSIRPLDRELRVKDESQITILKSADTWYEDNEWQVYLPSSGYQLSLATEQIDHKNTPTAAQTAPLPAGLFRLTLTQEKHDGVWHVKVTKDGAELLKIDGPFAWTTSRGAIGASHYTTPTQFKPAEKVVLFRRPSARNSLTPTKPSEGLLLWIEPIPPTK